MFVDPELLRSGGNQSHRAGEHAQEGTNQLSQGSLMSGMFGEFAAAEAFYEAVTSAHTQHLKTLQVQRETLTDVGRKAHYAASGFTNMDEHNAVELRAVRPGSAR